MLRTSMTTWTSPSPRGRSRAARPRHDPTSPRSHLRSVERRSRKGEPDSQAWGLSCSPPVTSPLVGPLLGISAAIIDCRITAPRAPRSMTKAAGTLVKISIARDPHPQVVGARRTCNQEDGDQAGRGQLLTDRCAGRSPRHVRERAARSVFVPSVAAGHGGTPRLETLAWRSRRGRHWGRTLITK